MHWLPSPAHIVLLSLLLAPACLATRIVYCCLGSCFHHQPYLWHSMYQTRIFNPDTPIDLIINDPELLLNPAFLARQGQFQFDAHVYDPAALAGIHAEFKNKFFIKGSMTPGGNKNFNLYTTQRFFALHWFMVSQNVTSFWHMENDNLVYANLENLVPSLHACNVRFSVPFTDLGMAIIMYVDDEAALQKFLRFILDVFKMSKSEASKFLGDEYVNDMTILTKYFDLNEHMEGVVKFPCTDRFKTGENCLWDKYKYMFDASVIGQWFGGTWAKPGVPQWWPERNFDPRAMKLTWQNSPSVGHKVPYLDTYRVINIHVHSKQLINFMSPVNNNILKLRK